MASMPVTTENAYCSIVIACCLLCALRCVTLWMSSPHWGQNKDTRGSSGSNKDVLLLISLINPQFSNHIPYFPFTCKPDLTRRIGHPRSQAWTGAWVGHTPRPVSCHDPWCHVTPTLLGTLQNCQLHWPYASLPTYNTICPGSYGES